MDFAKDAGETILNREDIEKCEEAGCTECGAIFAVDEIKDWEGKEAICPRCLYKSVVGLHFGGTTIEHLSILSIKGVKDDLKDLKQGF